MLMPKRTKFRKMQKGRVKGTAQRGAQVAFGDFGIKTLDPGWITSRQIEAARIAMTRHMKRAGKVWIRIFPDKPITKKPAETRMGKGKGSPEHFVAVVKPGRILFEVGGVPEDIARESMRLAIQKLPVKCKVVVRPDYFTVEPANVERGEDTTITATITTQDLTKIYGLGKTLAAALEAAGVTTYEGLAALGLDRLREIVEASGTDQESVNEETWAQQARLLAEGKHDELATYVEGLRAEDGNEVSIGTEAEVEVERELSAAEGGAESRPDRTGADVNPDDENA